jgi:hypothetical protein
MARGEKAEASEGSGELRRGKRRAVPTSPAVVEGRATPSSAQPRRRRQRAEASAVDAAEEHGDPVVQLVMTTEEVMADAAMESERTLSPSSRAARFSSDSASTAASEHRAVDTFMPQRSLQRMLRRVARTMGGASVEEVQPRATGESHARSPSFSCNTVSTAVDTYWCHRVSECVRAHSTRLPAYARSYPRPSAT